MSLTGAECKGHSFTISAKPPVSLFYRVAYLVGFKPWDRGVSPPELVAAVGGPRPFAPGEGPRLGAGPRTTAALPAPPRSGAAAAPLLPPPGGPPPPQAGAGGVGAP